MYGGYQEAFSRGYTDMPVHPRFGICLCLAIALFGCTKIPEHDLAKKADSAGLCSISEEALASGQFTEGEWPSASWWESYNDPNLNQLIEIALENSPTLKIAEERLKMAVQAAKAQRGYLFPEVNLTGSDNWQHFGKNSFFRSLAPTVPPVINQIDLDLNFAYEFDFWGKNRSAYKAALGEASAMRAELAQSALILTSSIAYSYFQYQVTALKLELQRKIASNREQLLALAKSRFTFALDNSLDEAAALQAYLEAEKAVVASEEDLKLQLEQMKALSGLGQDGELLVSPPGSITGDCFCLPDNLSLDLLARRPDLMARRFFVEKAAQEIRVAKTAFYPSINLLAFAGLESLKFNTFFEKQSAMSSLNPAFHLPIFTAGRLRAELKGKAAAFSQAVQQYNDLILQAAKEVAMQLTQIVKIGEQIELQRKVVETVAHNTQLVKERFLRAIDPLSDVLVRSNDELAQEISLAELDYSRRLASILLIRSLGGGYLYD